MPSPSDQPLSRGTDVVLDSRRTVSARRVLVATGLTDELPDLPGVWERWGRDVLHCPYCHGYEVRDQPVGVLGSGPRSVHQALLVRQLSPDVVFFRHTLADFPPRSGSGWPRARCGSSRGQLDV